MSVSKDENVGKALAEVDRCAARLLDTLPPGYVVVVVGGCGDTASVRVIEAFHRMVREGSID